MSKIEAAEGVERYTCFRTEERMEIDGRLDEAAWRCAPRSPRFVQMKTGRVTLFDTRAAMLWDDECLYIGFWLEERDVWCTGERRTSLIWRENGVDLFVAGEGAYYDLSVAPDGRTAEIFFVWKDAYQRGGRYDLPEFDLAVQRPMVFGGDAGFPHPRGMRWGFLDWRFPGLEVGVQVQGSLDLRSDVDEGWSVEIALPWKGMIHLADGRSLPPREGDVWRIGLARREVVDQRGVRATAVWTWPLLGEDHPHVPERYLAVEFSRMSPPDSTKDRE